MKIFFKFSPPFNDGQVFHQIEPIAQACFVSGHISLMYDEFILYLTNKTGVALGIFQMLSTINASLGKF